MAETTPTPSAESPATLLELAERVEAAIGPDRELDGDIAEALGLAPGWAGPRSPHHSRDQWSDGRDYWDAPRFTSSLDAAMTLAEGQRWCGGAPALLNEAESRLYQDWARKVGEERPSAGTWPPEPGAYREALARFMTASCLTASCLRARVGMKERE